MKSLINLMELGAKIEALESAAKTIREHAAGKREYGWADQAKGLELALAIVEGQIEGLRTVESWCKEVPA